MRKEEKEEKNSSKLRVFIILVILIISLVIIYGRFVEPNLLLVNEQNIEDNTLDKTFGTLKIVHFSDILYGSTTDIDTVKKVVEIINNKKADIVIYTGFKECEFKHLLAYKKYLEAFQEFPNIIIKYGRFIPNQEKHYDEVLGVELASPNQYARRIS